MRRRLWLLKKAEDPVAAHIKPRPSRLSRPLIHRRFLFHFQLNPRILPQNIASTPNS